MGRERDTLSQRPLTLLCVAVKRKKYVKNDHCVSAKNAAFLVDQSIAETLGGHKRLHERYIQQGSPMWRVDGPV